MEGQGRAGAPGVGDILVRVAGQRPGVVVVAGIDPGPATWFAEVWPERVLTVQPPQARMSVAEGIVAGGRDVIVIWDGEETTLPLPPEVAAVVLSASPDHLQLAHRASITVLQPGWPEDLPAVLSAALDLGVGVLLHLPDHRNLATSPPMPLSSPLGGPRVLRRGRDGMVLGAGATASVAAAVALELAARGCRVTALDAVIITPGSGLDAALLHDHLLVGGLDVPRAAALAEVAVEGGVPAVTQRVLEVLRPSAR